MYAIHLVFSEPLENPVYEQATHTIEDIELGPHFTRFKQDLHRLFTHNFTALWAGKPTT